VTGYIEEEVIKISIHALLAEGDYDILMHLK